MAALPGYSLGRQIRLVTPRGAKLEGIKVALIGANEAAAQAVRAYLYRMAYPFPPQEIADLGNLRRNDPASFRSVLLDLISANILPVVMAAPDVLARVQFLVYEDMKSVVNLAVVDEQLRTAETSEVAPEQAVYVGIVHPRHPLLFYFGLIGYQTHLVPHFWIEHLAEHHFELLRLGKSRAAIEEAEPILRDADLLCFHLAALKGAEAPGVLHPSPSGYTWEEACQLCRYAGMSDKLTSVGFYGMARETCTQTAQGVAQMIWYFLEGFFQRKGDFPLSTDGLKEYIVDFRDLNFQLTFWKSTRSGRWWLQAPAVSSDNLGRHYLIPCSFQDYQAACREELPDRLLQALRRFS